MVLSMGHSGVKYIIEKVSHALEQEFKIKTTNVRDKIMDRDLVNNEKKQVTVDKELI